MVLVKYKGQNYLMFGKTKIVNGFNDIADEEFYKLMKQPSFASRISGRHLSVPNGFPLEDPKAAEKLVAKNLSKANHSEEKESEEHEEDEESTPDRLSVKQTLRAIQKSEDAEYLKGLLDNDDRQKVKDASQKRLDALESKEKK